MKKIVIKEPFRIKQPEHDIILEKGDIISVVTESKSLSDIIKQIVFTIGDSMDHFRSDKEFIDFMVNESYGKIPDKVFKKMWNLYWKNDDGIQDMTSTSDIMLWVRGIVGK